MTVGDKVMRTYPNSDFLELVYSPILTIEGISEHTDKKYIIRGVGYTIDEILSVDECIYELKIIKKRVKKQLEKLEKLKTNDN